MTIDETALIRAFERIEQVKDGDDLDRLYEEAGLHERLRASIGAAMRDRRDHIDQEKYALVMWGAVAVLLASRPDPIPPPSEEYAAADLLASLSQCIADAEEALNSGVILAHRLDREDVRRALLTARSKLRAELGEATT